ncbi:hypothetical protein EA187_09090 [Lujinxingia sediminis]|uniref:ATP-grasp domain-containing protein n=1 Tax=Lujinxingia sediminis TaxID=2480984 RepID=A0ABY0CV35_9DELT|nr:hypothetical protein [Lujinxingia sediminis]RVU45902.1 hypothetical protein EA187_09090 [Lujinxingia sediminis]
MIDNRRGAGLRSWDVQVVTCAQLPEPDEDMAPLMEALKQAGLRARRVVWDDASVDWGESSLTVIRSTWDYHRRRDAFVAWAQAAGERSELLNPAEVVAWNTHKRYLLTLALRGVAAVPTAMIERGSCLKVGELCEDQGWEKIVVKPAVSAGSYQTHVMEAGAIDEDVVAALVAAEDVLVQPYVASVDDYGERSLIFIDGELTHSVRKAPRFAGEDESVSGPHPVDAAERELGERALKAVGGEGLLYARVDLVRGVDGAPMVAELELVEPSLFFNLCPAALERYVAGVKRRLG